MKKMKKNLFEVAAAEKIIKRIEGLEVDSPNLWGQMCATEMLLHCNSCNKEVLYGEWKGKETSIKQFVLRIVALYIAPNFKKGIKSEPHHITRGKISNSDFEKQKTEFIELIKQLHLNKRPFTLTHPAFGNISNNEWGIAVYKHMDHHLRQFGL